MTLPIPRRTLLASLVAVALAACGGSDDSTTPAPAPTPFPTAPQGVGHAEVAASADESGTPPFVDNAATNQRGDARYTTLQTNAGVRVLAPFLDLWQPRSPFVDAGQTAAAN